MLGTLLCVILRLFSTSQAAGRENQSQALGCLGGDVKA